MRPSFFRATQHLTSGFLIDFAEAGRTAPVRANFVAIHLWAMGYRDTDVDPNGNWFVAGGVLAARVSLGVGRLADHGDLDRTHLPMRRRVPGDDRDEVGGRDGWP